MKMAHCDGPLRQKNNTLKREGFGLVHMIVGKLRSMKNSVVFELLQKEIEITYAC